MKIDDSESQTMVQEWTIGEGTTCERMTMGNQKGA